ncbi:50S ribosomal protein L30 [Nakamurella endophytica]|uniref:Large ribosomal subunit protein uL30 n=1 Tax=Nakamurella endophytica TaxID=1748367 RepID=A0A917SZ11_9ACTN|nr:50S ribosomal protein L30 [Nakamurella endophytica]GGM03271.1 50S ribosomal protein L30 [Nakamurella endophytica]
MAQLKITQVRSTIGNKRNARESVRSLGLKRIHHSVVVDDSPAVRGYIRSATHLLVVEPVAGERLQGSDEQ